MNRLIRLATASLLLFTLSTPLLLAQDIVRDSLKRKLEIPDEIINRIPSSEVAQFLEARQRVVDKMETAELSVDAYEEIGIDKEILRRIPGSELFGFLNERGYVEILPHEHIGDQQNHAQPAPEEMIRLLFTLVLIVVGVIILSIVLAHLRKTKEQEIIIKALENDQEIPLSLFQSSKQQTYLSHAVLFLVLGLGLLTTSWFDILPPALAFIPISISIGYFILRFLNREKEL